MNRILIFITIIFIFGIGAFFIFSQSGQRTTEENNVSIGTATEKRIEGYSGKVLAGNSSPFLEFNKKDYENVLASEKIIFLDFYANWCPICRAESPEINAGFDSLTSDKIVGFRVNFNDTETDEDEKNLAKEFNVPYQHTKIIVQNGKEISRSVDQWDKEKFLKELENF